MDKSTKPKKQSPTATHKGNSGARVKKADTKKSSQNMARDKMAVGGEQNAATESLSGHTTKDSGMTPVIQPSRAAKRALDNREGKFVLEYLLSLDPKEAAIKAGYSASLAASKAYQWVSNGKVKPHVFAAIEKGRQKTAGKLELTREAVIAQYQRLGFSDPRKFFDAHNQLKAIPDLDDDTAAALQGFEVEMRMVDGPGTPPVPVVKVKWADRKAALDSIMKAQGWNSAEKHELTGKNGGPIEHAVRVVLIPPKEKAEVTVRPIADQSPED